MKKLLIATHNTGKLKELSQLLSHLPITLLSLSDLNITEDIAEDGRTYEENAKKKAIFFSRLTGLPTISDDGGIEIAALDNKPGIHSKRWLGREASEEELFAHLQKVANALPEENRKASFVVAIALSLPDGNVWVEKERIDGVIVKKPFKVISKGYPYRSFFFLPGLGKYYHADDMTKKEMESYSHRQKAIKALVPQLKKVFLL